MQDLSDYPLTTNQLRKEFPTFRLSSDIQEQENVHLLLPFLNWLGGQGFEINIQTSPKRPAKSPQKDFRFFGTIKKRKRTQIVESDNSLNVTKEVIFKSFGILESGYLKRLIF